MSKKWKRIKSRLEQAENREFERKAIPFIRAIWWDAVTSQPMKTLDRSGADILRWESKTEAQIPLIIQCKGFEVKEIELGKSQIDQCKKSIESFLHSGFKTETYIFLINRNLKDENFRSSIQDELEALTASGKAKKAYLWSYQDLIRNAELKVRERCIRLISLNKTKAREIQLDTPICAPLEDVPLQISEMVISVNKKESEMLLSDSVADPAKLILENDISNIALILAKAGYGKTTSALRSFQFTKRKVFYLSAASISREVNNRQLLLKSWIKLEDIWEDILDEDFEVLDELVSLAIDYLLKNRENPVALILDALDESVYFSRPQGLQDLFNQIADIKVPVVLLAREEYWKSKQKHFVTFFGLKAHKSHKLGRKRSISVYRLKDWEKAQIKAFAHRYRDTLSGSERDNLNQLIAIIDSNKYEEIYGDIPKRPLFLNYILESVAQEGIKPKGKARLFYEWVELKIKRDIFAPVIVGGDGRPSLMQGQNMTEEDIIRLSFKTMKIAASKMTAVFSSEVGLSVDLLPFCDVEEIKEADSTIKASMDFISLFLHSLLEEEAATSERQTVRFSHRTYQEFFLALHVRDYPDFLDNAELPESVQNHLKEIKAETI